jgi:hypothetical protein
MFSTNQTWDHFHQSMKRKNQEFSLWDSVGNFFSNLIHWNNKEPQEEFELPVAKKRKYEPIDQQQDPQTPIPTPTKPIATKYMEQKTPLDVMKTFVHKNTKMEYPIVPKKEVPKSAFGKPIKQTPLNLFSKRKVLNYSINESKYETTVTPLKNVTTMMTPSRENGDVRRLMDNLDRISTPLMDLNSD